MDPELVTLAPGFVVSRIAKGNWQLAERHGAPYARAAAIDDMRRFVEAGITLFDCADHYVGVEQLIGEFRRRHPEHARRLRVSTKLVPDLASLRRLRRGDVERIVDTSLARLGQERLDLVQFHWWDYRVPGYVEAMHWLDDLKSAGKVELVGATNFDTARLSEIVASGVSIATNQLQYSVLDHRPEHGLSAFCAAHGIKLLCYGTLAGGFIAEQPSGPHQQAAHGSRTEIPVESPIALQHRDVVVIGARINGQVRDGCHRPGQRINILLEWGSLRHLGARRPFPGGMLFRRRGGRIQRNSNQSRAAAYY